MHCQAIPSNLDRVKQAFDRFDGLLRAIDPMTRDAVMRAAARACVTSPA
jgi:hypothetical protein